MLCRNSKAQFNDKLISQVPSLMILTTTCRHSYEPLIKDIFVCQKLLPSQLASPPVSASCSIFARGGGPCSPTDKAAPRVRANPSLSRTERSSIRPSHPAQSLSARPLQGSSATRALRGFKLLLLPFAVAPRPRNTSRADIAASPDPIGHQKISRPDGTGCVCGGGAHTGRVGRSSSVAS
jgi:hypothetical protein